MKHLKRNITMLFLCVGVIPLFVLLLLNTLFILIKPGNLDSHDYNIIVIILSFILLCVSLIVTVVIIAFVNKTVKRIIEITSTISSGAEKRMLGELSFGSGYAFVLGNLELLQEKNRLADEIRDKNIALKFGAENSPMLFFTKKSESELFEIEYIDYWKKVYPGLMLGSNFNLFNVVEAAELSDFKSLILHTEAAPGRVFQTALTLRAGAGVKIKAIIKGNSYITSDGGIVIAGAIADTTVYKKAEKTALEYKAMYEFLVGDYEDIIIEVDYTANSFVLCTPKAWNDLFNIEFSGDNFLATRENFIKLIHSDFTEGYLDRFMNLNHILSMPNKSLTYEYRLKNKRGDYIWVEDCVRITADEDGEVTKFISKITNISEKKRRELRKKVQSNHDSLTGAFLRSHIEDDYNEYIRENKGAILILAKITNLGFINEEHSHEIGDLALRKVVNACWEHSLDDSIVGRTDGDTFALFIKNSEPLRDRCVKIPAEIAEKFSESISLGNYMINLNVHVALVHYKCDGESFDSIYKRGEKALEQAAELGFSKSLVTL